MIENHSGSDKASHWIEKSEEQLHKAIPGEHKIKVNTRRTRQSESSPLDNLRSIAAGKGSITRVRSRARVPVRTAPAAAKTSRPRPEKLETENVVANSNRIAKDSVEDTEDVSNGPKQQPNTIDTQRIRRKKKKNPAHRKSDIRFSYRNLKRNQRKEARLQKQLKRVKEIEDREDQPVPKIFGCHQVCDTLIFEVYKLLRGRQCDCY
eukprot:TRINITY_DN7122_c0_g1_i1.p1 TRINITY_DN7122_c0_g1~~TRINITY_DN7122_c0_g1_i1.p1  ORF type:complete len:207 (-),score=33.92 TRINITY_DN7122_c0_g1_i1:61-681(-)